VDHGTGEAARIEGMRIAGKTGTSRKFAEGQYVPGDYTASFVGFFPAEAPQVVCLIMLDKPKVGGYYGGQASAPIFKAIAEKVAAMPGAFTRQPSAPVPGREPVVVPDVIAMDAGIAAEILESHGFDVEGGEGVVLGQSPRPGTRVTAGQRVRLTTSAAPPSAGDGTTVVPDLRGLSIRRALNRLTAARLGAVVSGSGLVSAQTPRAGEKVRSGSRVALRCAPRPAMLASGR
jgi:membrane peptidoglycan carboxypeptidase